MNSPLISARSLGLIAFIVVVLGLCCYFCLDLLQSDERPAQPPTDQPAPYQGAGPVEPVVDSPEGPVPDSEVEIPVPSIMEEESLFDKPKVRDRIEPKQAQLFCIRGQAVMKDGSALPPELKITCLDREPPFSLRDAPDPTGTPMVENSLAVLSTASRSTVWAIGSPPANSA